MQPEEFIFEYRDANLQLQGQIPTPYVSAKIQPVRNGVGAWSLKLPSEHRAAVFLGTPGAGLVVTDVVTGKVIISGPTTKPSRRVSAADPEGTVTVSGISDDCILWDARAWPSPALPVESQQQGYDIRAGAAEDVIRAFVNANIGPGAPASRRARLASYLQLMPSLSRGKNVTKSVRFDSLGDTLNEIATGSGLRFRVVQVGNILQLQIEEVADLSGVIRLDVHNGTISEQSVESAPPEVTDVIVAGQGVGVERKFLKRTSVESIAAEQLWGRKIELFKDQRNTNDDLELVQSGDEILAADGFTRNSLKIVPSNDQTMIMGRDWNVGDLVAAVVDGVELKSTTTEAAYIIDNSGVIIGAAIGDVTAFKSDSYLRAALNDTTKRVDALERTAESLSDAAVQSIALPSGSIIMGAWLEAPSGYLLCRGQAVSRTDYSRLFASVGVAYGSGDGSSTFNVPNMSGRVPVGVDTADATFNTPNKTGGAKTHTLTTGEMPAHKHTLAQTNSAGGGSSRITAGPGPTAAITDVDVGSTGGGGAHNNLQPFVTVNYAIKT